MIANERPRRAPLRWMYRLFALTIVSLLGLGMVGTAGAAGPLTPQAALVRLLTATHLQDDWFAPSFLAQVSAAQVESVLANAKATLGAYRSVKAQPDGSYLITFAKGTDRAQIALDAQGRITGLFFAPPHLTHANPAAALKAFHGLPGHVSVLVTTNGTTTLALNPAQPLAIGSAFKLAVLAALRRRVAAGKLSWSTVVTLTERDISLPSGILQSWPAGTPLTVATLAGLMISQSDNTAADTLVHLVGRAAIDPLIPARDRPLLTTRELFVLKDPAHKDLRDAYLRGDEAQRLAILTQADALALPSPALFSGGPVAPQIEWFFSTRELCGLMQQVHDLPLMGINPGVADRSAWASVAYKGGSEPGVLNLTTMVTTTHGTAYCVSATWNNTASLDENRFETMYSALLSTLS